MRAENRLCQQSGTNSICGSCKHLWDLGRKLCHWGEGRAYGCSIASVSFFFTWLSGYLCYLVCFVCVGLFLCWVCFGFLFLHLVARCFASLAKRERDIGQTRGPAKRKLKRRYGSRTMKEGEKWWSEGRRGRDRGGGRRKRVGRGRAHWRDVAEDREGREEEGEEGCKVRGMKTKRRKVGRHHPTDLPI